PRRALRRRAAARGGRQGAGEAAQPAALRRAHWGARPRHRPLRPEPPAPREPRALAHDGPRHPQQRHRQDGRPRRAHARRTRRGGPRRDRPPAGRGGDLVTRGAGASPWRAKLWRDLRRLRGPFIAVAVTSFLGVALFGTSYGAYRNLVASYDRLFEVT